MNQQPKNKILIIDDSESIRELIKIYLESTYELSFAVDGEQGLTMARRTKPDLIMLDIMLPKMDGFTVSRLLKFDELYRDIPIIMFSSRAGSSDIKTSQDTGADLYLLKPFTKEQLTDILIKALNP